MEKLLVVVFDTEKKAYEGSQALLKLDNEGSIAIHGEAVIQKNPDGTIDIKKLEDEFPLRTLTGTALGSLIGLIGGPVGAAVGAGIGATAGIIGDTYVTGTNAEFLEEVSQKLTPGKFAVIADISEEWITPLDAAMETLGGVVFRSAKATVEAEQRAREIAELQAEIAELRAEHAQAKAERKARIQARMEKLNATLQERVDKANKRMEELQNEANAKLNALQQKVVKAHRENKAAFEGRIAEIRNHYEEAEAKLRNATANQLRKAAARLEKVG